MANQQEIIDKRSVLPKKTSPKTSVIKSSYFPSLGLPLPFPLPLQSKVANL